MNAGLVYNQGEGGMNSYALEWPAGTDLTDPVLLTLYDVTAMQGVETYSDLDFSQIDLSLGGQYAFTSNLHVSADFGYKKFNDEQPYVYGDQDGTAYTGYLGIGYRF